MKQEEWTIEAAAEKRSFNRCIPSLDGLQNLMGKATDPFCKSKTLGAFTPRVQCQLALPIWLKTSPD
eukprot:6017877-Amphidinium_carterae.1